MSVNLLRRKDGTCEMLPYLGCVWVFPRVEEPKQSGFPTIVEPARIGKIWAGFLKVERPTHYGVLQQGIFASQCLNECDRVIGDRNIEIRKAKILKTYRNHHCMGFVGIDPEVCYGLARSVIILDFDCAWMIDDF